MNSLFDSIRKIGYRRGPERIVGGIAGGLAKVTGLNVWIVRLLVLASFLLPVLGVGAYLVVWAITPWQDGSIPLQRAFGGAGRLER
ncbi:MULTISPECIES: PspC domain-containing protein [Brevibacterium]|uniref:PspC domain-containing protein n=1 Tax=Brevibacterium casei TaxID=33889 RepID=A0A7T4DJQ5_9MICO|nr:MULTISPECIES: PspC domain-containing protein [Brevibacterium]QQB14631.1 PspC domain-containing protein [Brevibacterium casei]